MAAWGRRCPRALAVTSSTSWTRRCCAWHALLHPYHLRRSSSGRCCRARRISCVPCRACSAKALGSMKVALVALEIPKVGLVMESARLVRWLKGVGDMVQQGEPVLELETEKSVVEIESTTSG